MTLPRGLEFKLDPFDSMTSVIARATTQRKTVRRPPVQVFLDCDGVLCDWLSGVRQLIVATGGEEAWNNDYLSTWGFVWDGSLPRAIHDEVNAVVNTASWWAQLPIMPGALQAYRRLYDEVGSARIRVVTAPDDYCPGWADARKSWLAREFGIASKRVVIGPDKAEWLGDGIFFEDRADTLVRWLARGNVDHRLGIFVGSGAILQPQLTRLTPEERELWDNFIADGSIVWVADFAEGVDYITGDAVDTDDLTINDVDLGGEG